MSNIQVDINPNNFKWALLREDRNGGYSDVSFYRTRLYCDMASISSLM